MSKPDLNSEARACRIASICYGLAMLAIAIIVAVMAEGGQR